MHVDIHGKVSLVVSEFKEYILYRKLVNTRNMIYCGVCSAVIELLHEDVGE